MIGDPVEDLFGVPPTRYEADLPQGGQVLRQRGLAESKGYLEFSDRSFASRQMRNDEQPNWIGEALQELRRFDDFRTG